jgi:hypothetical protein
MKPEVGEVYKRLGGARRSGIEPGDLVAVTWVKGDDEPYFVGFLIFRCGVETSLPWHDKLWERATCQN